MLFDLPVKGVGGEPVDSVEKLLLLVLLPVEELVEEPVVLLLLFRSLLNAPRLEIGGLELTLAGSFACGDSGAA
jgi:hypothetical protein